MSRTFVRCDVGSSGETSWRARERVLLFRGLRVRMGIHSMGAAAKPSAEVAFDKAAGRMQYSGRWSRGTVHSTQGHAYFTGPCIVHRAVVAVVGGWAVWSVSQLVGWLVGWHTLYGP